MKVLAIILNIALLYSVVWLVYERGFPSDDGKEVLFYIVLITCPIVNLIAHFRKGWLGLYFQRKAIEERKKIEALDKDD
jgi:hypothetical protein